MAGQKCIFMYATLDSDTDYSSWGHIFMDSTKLQHQIQTSTKEKEKKGRKKNIYLTPIASSGSHRKFVTVTNKSFFCEDKICIIQGRYVSLASNTQLIWFLGFHKFLYSKGGDSDRIRYRSNKFYWGGGSIQCTWTFLWAKPDPLSFYWCLWLDLLTVFNPVLTSLEPNLSVSNPNLKIVRLHCYIPLFSVPTHGGRVVTVGLDRLKYW